MRRSIFLFVFLGKGRGDAKSSAGQRLVGLRPRIFRFAAPKIEEKTGRAKWTTAMLCLQSSLLLCASAPLRLGDKKLGPLILFSARPSRQAMTCRLSETSIAASYAKGVSQKSTRRAERPTAAKMATAMLSSPRRKVAEAQREKKVEENLVGPGRNAGDRFTLAPRLTGRLQWRPDAGLVSVWIDPRWRRGPLWLL
jgi:hypothetical protein